MSDDQERKPELLSDAQKLAIKQLAENAEVKAAVDAATKGARRAVIKANIQQGHKATANRYIKEALARILQEQRERAEKKEADQLQAAIRWVENKWNNQPCPYCQHVEWQVGTPLELSVSGDEVMSPAFPVMCGNCGHTTFVNAIRAGLVPEAEEDET